MDRGVTRRGFLNVGAGVAAAAAGGWMTRSSAAGEAAAPAEDAVKIVAVSCSPRAGKTTAAGLQVALDAARAVAPDRIEVELIELAGLSIPGGPAAGVALQPGEKDDFPAIAEKLAAPNLAGIIIGTPVYFASMSYLCKAFLDRCGMFRRDNFGLSGKVAGVLSVGGVRSGGQELTIQMVQPILLCHEMIVVGDARPTGHFGARLWNQGDDISGDEFGLSTARNLGRRVAEVCLERAHREA
jgi:multimeric flavodoxin WrbA